MISHKRWFHCVILVLKIPLKIKNYFKADKKIQKIYVAILGGGGGKIVKFSSGNIFPSNAILRGYSIKFGENNHFLVPHKYRSSEKTKTNMGQNNDVELFWQMFWGPPSVMSVTQWLEPKHVGLILIKIDNLVLPYPLKIWG